MYYYMYHNSFDTCQSEKDACSFVTLIVLSCVLFLLNWLLILS